MKKALSLFCLILLLLYGALHFLGLLEKSPYVAEMRFWKARVFAREVLMNPDATPPRMFEEARKRYEYIIKEHPPLARKALLPIVEILIKEKKYQEARDLLTQARQDYPNYRLFGARSQFLIGFSYEKGGDWKRALKEYQFLIDQYTGTRPALQTPLYIARHDLRQDSGKGARSYKEAATYYRRLIKKKPKSPFGLLAMGYLLTGYQEQNKWDESLEVIQEIILAYPRMIRGYIPTIESLSRRIDRPEKAIAIYESFIKSHPDHRDSTVLRERIDRFRKES